MNNSAGVLTGCSWSGGKDSCYALLRSIRDGHKLVALVNMMNEEGIRSRSHGLPLTVLQQQADALGVPIITTPASWANYQEKFIETLNSVKQTLNVTQMVFGDIDLQAHRDWEEMVCAKAGISAYLPLWLQDRLELVSRMMEDGIKATIVSCNELMGEAFLGKEIQPHLIAELQLLGVDPCGENGEYHTVVTDCPMFSSPVLLPAFRKVKHENYWFLDW